MTSKALDNVAKLRDIVNVRDFGASPTASAAVNTAAIQAAIDYVYALPRGGTVEIHGSYSINAPLIIGTFVELRGPGTLTQVTNNTPIVKVTKAAFSYMWSIRQLTLLYQNLQPASNTDARAIVLTQANIVVWHFVIEDVLISGAAKGIDAPEEANAFAFLGTFNNVSIGSCSDWGFHWKNANSGGTTFLSMNNVWVNNTEGSEIAGSKGFYIRNCVSLCINSIACDNVQNSPLFLQNCVGNIGVIAIETCDLNTSSGSSPVLVNFSNCSLIVGEIGLENNRITVSGTDFGAGVRATDSSYVRIGVLRDSFNAVNDTSSDDYYTVSVASDAQSVYIDRYSYAANTSPPAGFATAPNGAVSDLSVPQKLRLFAENTRCDVRGNRQHIFTTSVPTSGTWAVGDTAWNVDPTTDDEPVGWICRGAGTPGVWRPFAAPSSRQAAAADIAAIGNAVNTTGKFLGLLIWDTTNNRMMRSSGSAAGDVWWVIDGSTSVTPS
jgi:hypothetical protein